MNMKPTTTSRITARPIQSHLILRKRGIFRRSLRNGLVRAESGVGIGGAALVVEDAAILDVNDPVGPGLEARVMGHADDGGAVIGGGATQQADDHLAVLAVEGR